jgi:hypothetical protein
MPSPRHGVATRVAVVCLSLVLPSCIKSGDSSDVWSHFLKKCSGGQQVNMKTVLFFTLSNNIGPGSVWRKSQANDDYIPVRVFDLQKGDHPSLFNKGNDSDCTGVTSSTTEISGNASVERLIPVVPVSLGARIKKARKVTVTANSWAWDQLLAGPYEDMLTNLPETDAYRRSVLRDSLVVGRAVRLNGLAADVEFSKVVADSLKASLPLNIGGSLGMTGAWTEEGTLHLKTSAPAYVAVQFWKLQTGGFAGLLDTSAVVIPPGARAVDSSNVHQ